MYAPGRVYGGHLDFQAFLRITEAIEAAENSKLARDAAVRRESELANEVRELNCKLKSHKQETQQELQVAHNEEIKKLLQQLENAEDEANRARHKVSDAGWCH